MPLSYLKVIGIVRRCNLNRSGSKFLVYIVICDNRNLPVCQRQLTGLSYNRFISLVIRVYGDCRISR